MKTTQKGITSIVIVSVVVLMLFIILFPKVINTKNESEIIDFTTKSNIAEIETETLYSYSGVTINIEANQSLPLRVSGSIDDNKKWRILEGEAGTIKMFGIVAGKAKQIDIKPITLERFDYDMQPPLKFNLEIGDREWISNLDSKKIYIVLSENSAKEDDVVDKIRINYELK